MPEDRYKQTNKRTAMRARRARSQAEFEAEAAAENAKGRYLCADCQDFYPEAAFEYEFEGKTHYARRCEPCRAVRRKSKGNRRRTW